MQKKKEKKNEINPETGSMSSNDETKIIKLWVSQHFPIELKDDFKIKEDWMNC